MTPRSAPARGLVAPAVAIGVVGGVLVATSAVDDLRVTGALIALGALCGVPALLMSGPRPGRPPAFRVAGAAMTLVLGVGELVNLVQQLFGTPEPSHPPVGDIITLGAAPLAMVTVLLLPRPGGRAWGVRRLVPDTVIVASAGAMVLWRYVFLGNGPSAGHGVLALVITMTEVAVLSLLLSVAVIGRDRAVLLVVGGALLLLVGDTSVAAATLGGAQAPSPLGIALRCAAWPLVWGGLLLLRPEVPEVDPAEQAGVERRASAVTVVAVLVAGVLLLASLGPRVLDVVSIVLLNLVVAGIVLHVLASQRQHLVQVAGLLHLADHDPLTGVGNRRALFAALSAVGGSGDHLGVVVLNLDGFSSVNDRFGQRGGDAVLVAVAGALSAAVPDGVAVFRLGGDEFALVGPLAGDEMLAVAQAARAAVAGATATAPGMGGVRLSASCGVHGAPASGGHAGDPMAVVGLASNALQAARRAGRDRAVLWSEDLAADDRRRELVEARLRHALVAGGLEVHLQPVVDVATGAVRAFEALSRWTDAELGAVSPVEFVAVAESSGLVVPLGRQVMADALSALVATGGLQRGMSVAVNASPVELRREGFVASVTAALAAHGVPADLLVVEVTEAVFVSADDPAVAALDELAALGVRVAVDDFGTGYSSLSYLTRLPVHELKIDRSLTSRLHEGPTHAVVTALVGMADALDLEVVAEGVEETAQADALAAMGVTRGQGWLWSRALPVAEATALLSDQHRPCPADGPPLAADLGRRAP